MELIDYLLNQKRNLQFIYMPTILRCTRLSCWLDPIRRFESRDINRKAIRCVIFVFPCLWKMSELFDGNRIYAKILQTLYISGKHSDVVLAVEDPNNR